MVGGGAQAPLGMAPMHPVLVGLWRNMKKPKLSGLPKNAAQFVRDWTEVETIIQSSSSYPVSDYALLLELRGCLDEEASSEVLKSRIIYENNQCWENWDSFRQEWGIDMLKQNQMDWYAVKLTPGTGGNFRRNLPLPGRGWQIEPDLKNIVWSFFN
jgi:hypothetical protein